MKEDKSKYDEIFSTDWNKGENSKMNYQDRNRIAALWIEYHSLKDEIEYGIVK